MSKSYESRPYGPLSRTAIEDAPNYWRDTDVALTGPVVAQLQALFVQHWHDQAGPELNEAGFFPKLAPAGSDLVRIIGTAPAKEVPRYYVTLLSAIRTAEQRIWLTTAYFVPTDDEIADLIDAAQRGVDVRLLLPGKSDSDLSLNVGHSHYEELLEGGVKIYELSNEILHSKTAVIDGVWSVVGSSNFDHRSVLFNDEIDAVILGRDTARQMETIIQDELQATVPIDLKIWRERPLVERLNEFFSRSWTNLL